MIITITCNSAERMVCVPEVKEASKKMVEYS